MSRFLTALLGAGCPLFAGNAMACDVAIGGSAAKVVSDSAVIFWGRPVEAHLLGADEQAPVNQVLAESFNGRAIFRVEYAVKGASQGAVVSAYFSADGTSCEMPISVGVDGFYFFREKEGDYYWGQYTQPEWNTACRDYLDVFEAEFGADFPVLRERMPGCRSDSD